MVTQLDEFHRRAPTVDAIDVPDGFPRFEYPSPWFDQNQNVY